MNFEKRIEESVKDRCKNCENLLNHLCDGKKAHCMKYGGIR